MFAKEFILSFSLLGFTIVLLLMGSILMIDAVTRLMRDSYRRGVKQRTARVPKMTPQQPKEKVTTVERAA